MSLNNTTKFQELEIKTVTVLKGKKLLHCSSGSHVYDKYSPGPLMWLQGKENTFNGELTRATNMNTMNITQENSWFCGPLDKEPYNVFYFYETRRPLRLLNNTDSAINEYLESKYRELFDKIPLETQSVRGHSLARKNNKSYPPDYVIPMILSQLYGDKYDGIYHWDGEIILWGPYEEKLVFLRKEYNESINPITPWILPNRGPGTRYYMPSEEIKNELRTILDPYMTKKGGKRNNYHKNKTRKNSKSRRTNRNRV